MWGQWKKAEYEGGIRKSWRTLLKSRIPLGLSCDIRTRFRKGSCCILHHSEEMKRNKVRVERQKREEWETAKGKQEQIVVKSVCEPAAEVSKRRWIALSGSYRDSFMACNPFSRQKHNDPTRKHSFMQSQTQRQCCLCNVYDNPKTNTNQKCRLGDGRMYTHSSVKYWQNLNCNKMWVYVCICQPHVYQILRHYTSYW